MKSFNYSALTTAYKCNTLFKYLYIDKIKSKDPDSGDMKFGTAIHLAVEAILTGDADYLGLFELFWNLEKQQNNKYGRYSWQDLREQGHVLLARFERLHKKNFSVLQMEQRLYGSIGDIKVEGTPDFIGDYRGKKTVVDFKTSGAKYSKDKAKTSEQLLLYAHLANQNLGFVAEQVLYVVFVKGRDPSIQLISAPIRPGLIDEVTANVNLQCEELTKKIESGKYSKNYSQCIMGEYKCPFFDKCHGETE